VNIIWLCDTKYGDTVLENPIPCGIMIKPYMRRDGEITFWKYKFIESMVSDDYSIFFYSKMRKNL
jgi:hypothetical protein